MAELETTAWLEDSSITNWHRLVSSLLGYGRLRSLEEKTHHQPPLQNQVLNTVSWQRNFFWWSKWTKCNSEQCQREPSTTPYSDRNEYEKKERMRQLRVKLTVEASRTSGSTTPSVMMMVMRRALSQTPGSESGFLSHKTKLHLFVAILFGENCMEFECPSSHYPLSPGSWQVPSEDWFSELNFHSFSKNCGSRGTDWNCLLPRICEALEF